MNKMVEALPVLSPAVRRTGFVVSEFSWIWLALVLLGVASAVLAPGTLRIGSIAAMLPFAAMLSLVAASQTLVIQQRGLDLSAAALVGMGGVLLAKCAALIGSPILAVVFALLICGAFGAINGVLVARIGISPIVATLASAAVLSGLARLATGGSALPIPPILQSISHAAFLGVPFTVLVAVALIVGMATLVKRTIVGRRFVAVGVNRQTAIASGTRAIRYEIATYAVAGALYALAGMLLASFIGYASATAGDDYLLPGIAAVVIGGTSFAGGNGSLIASGAAALFMAQLGQMVLALGAGAAEQLFVQAAAIVIAVSLRRIPFGNLRARLTTRS